MKVAFIGLGNMGSGMAGNLLKAGHELTVWNRTRGTAEKLKPHGAKIADSPADAVNQAEAVFTMLTDDYAVEAVVFGDRGLLGELPKDAVHISSSTISVDLTQRLAKAHAEHGQRLLSAPVFGRPEAAAAAKLFVLAGGDADTIKHCDPLLSAIGQKTFVMGSKPEMANVVKLSGNFLIAAMLECLGETIALTKKYGVDPQQFIDMLTNTLFAAPVYKTYGELIVKQKFEPAGFKMKLGLKDVRLALQAGESVAAPLPVASLVRDHFLAAIAKGRADLDWSALSQIAAENAGLKA